MADQPSDTLSDLHEQIVNATKDLLDRLKDSAEATQRRLDHAKGALAESEATLAKASALIGVSPDERHS